MAAIAGSVGQGGTNNPDDVKLVQTLLHRHVAWLDDVPAPEVTGRADAATIAAIRKFQEKAAALENDDGGVSPYGFTIRQLCRDSIPKPQHSVFNHGWYYAPCDVTAADHVAAARELGCEVAAIQAVALAQSGRAPWDENGDGKGRPTILFERHVFARLTADAYSRTHPDLSFEARGNYGSPHRQYARLTRAAVLDEAAALKATSWGAYQLLGMTHAAAGFATVGAFVDSMMAGEKAQLGAFITYLNSDPALLRALQDKDWALFASLYNGADSIGYDRKMAKHYAKAALAQ